MLDGRSPCWGLPWQWAPMAVFGSRKRRWVRGWCLEESWSLDHWTIPMSGNAIGVAGVWLPNGCRGVLGVKFGFNMGDPSDRTPVLDRGFVADDAAACGLQDQADATCLDSYVNELTQVQ